MEALHSGEGNSHPHRPPTPAVHTDTREVAERFPSEVVHISATISFEHQVQKGSTNNVADYLRRPPIVAITTVLNSCGHKTSDWLLIYKNDPEFSHTYKALLGGMQVPKFHLQDALLCHLGHLFVPLSELPR